VSDEFVMDAVVQGLPPDVAQKVKGMWTAKRNTAGMRIKKQRVFRKAALSVEYYEKEMLFDGQGRLKGILNNMAKIRDIPLVFAANDAEDAGLLMGLAFEKQTMVVSLSKQHRKPRFFIV